MNIYKCVLMLVSMALPITAAANADCTSMTSSRDILLCAEARSPEVKAAELDLDRAKLQVGAAGQWKNPDLSAETFQGTVNNEKRSETDISLGIPIELGGKISARTQIAESGVALAEARLFEAKARVRSQVLLNLHRLRQVLHEQQVADEAINIYTKLLGQYARRPGLSPEQQISAQVFRLSKNDYDLKKSAAGDEIAGLDSFFKLQLGKSAEEIRRSLPASPKPWPKVSASADTNKASPQMRLLDAELNSAKGELSLAQSEAWPTLTVGPSVKMQSEAGQSNSLYGFNLSLPIPVFNTNGGARAAANAGVKVSEARKQLGMNELTIKRDEIRKIYEQAVKSLDEGLSHDDIEKRHAESEKLFIKGVVPSALVIESHRTWFDLEKTRNEREMKALESLLQLYILDGSILEANL